MTEISTRTEVAGDLPNAIPEPTMTVSQFATLLHAAADLERAQRPPAPIVINGPEVQPAHVVHPTGHPGIDVRLPSPAEAAGIVVPWAPLRHPVSVRTWGATLAYCGIGSLLTGAADGVVSGAGTLSVGACIVGIAAIIAGIIRAQFEDGVN